METLIKYQKQEIRTLAQIKKIDETASWINWS
jgi:hypothetical protein